MSKIRLFFVFVYLITILPFTSKELKALAISNEMDIALKVKKIGNNLSGTIKDFQMVGNYIRHTRSNAIIDFQCTNAKVRLEICTDDIFRIRMSPTGKYIPDEPYVVIRYEWPATSFSLKDKGKYISIETDRMLIKAFKTPFRFEFFDLNGTPVNRDWKEGSMGFRADTIICKKELTETDHFFGLGQRFEESDMRGTKQTCLLTRNYTPVPFYLGTDGYGIFFHNSRASDFDFRQNPTSFSAPGGGELDYYFIYGPDFKHIINQYSLITGKSPLPPKSAFGLWFSSWPAFIWGQYGQKGLLYTIRAAREVWDWPLDAIRVHASGPEQNFWASPSTNWPDFSWTGAFPEVDKMVEKLHEQHILTTFWESPGVFDKTKMYEEGIKNNYFLTLDDKPFIGGFGYKSPEGGWVDFLNPEARKWWGKYHNFMVDFGSDGVAADGGPPRKNLISPSTGLKAEEFSNIYGLLYGQASWDAYRDRNPNKRSINFAVMSWAGGQRYPLLGTQDSELNYGHNEDKKRIFGEMMGCINLGLSGIPFRTYTDNVSRRLEPKAPLSRMSQYISLTVAGERTCMTVTGIPIVDWNYRFYGKLRYRLMPYIYTYAREATQTGCPLVRALVLEYQKDTATYSAFGQYLLGKELLIAPLWSDSTFYRNIYLPEGEWIDFFDEVTYQGKKIINYYAPIERAPIFVKAGAIIPMAPDNQHYIDEIKSPLTIHVYPRGNSSFELYEDDGESYAYEKGIYSITKFFCEELNKEVFISKGAPNGKYLIPERDHVFCVHKKAEVKDVTYGGLSLPFFRSEKEFNGTSEGWMLETTEKKLLWIKVKGSVNDAMEIKVSYF